MTCLKKNIALGVTAFKKMSKYTLHLCGLFLNAVRLFALLRQSAAIPHANKGDDKYQINEAICL